MKFLRYFLLAVTPVVFFSGCMGDDFAELNMSDGGILIEQLLPEDVAMLISITTKDIEQREAAEEFMAQFSGDMTEIDILESIQAEFESMGVEGVWGEEGFRMVIAYLEDGESFVAMTVADVAETQAWLNSIVAQGDATLLALGDMDCYVTETDGEEGYTALLGDVMIVTGDSAALLNAKGRFAAEDSVSLLSNDLYVDSVSKLKGPYIGYFYVDFDKFEGFEGAKGIFAMGSYLLESEVLALTFEEDAVLLNGYGFGNKDKIDELGIGLSDVSGDGLYLMDSVPGSDLIFYEESGGLAGLLDLWAVKSEEAEVIYGNVDTIVTQYLAMDFEEEVRPFLEDGYVVAVHGENGGLPGISFVIDVSGGSEAARELIDKIDTQIGSLVLIMQYDEEGGTSLTKTESGDFHVLSADLEELGFVGSGGFFEAPEGMDFSDVSLFYGVTEDDLLVISTYSGWEFFDGNDSVHIEESFGDTIFYFDLQKLVEWVPFLENFSEATFGAKASKYEVEVRGSVKSEILN